MIFSENVNNKPNLRIRITLINFKSTLIWALIEGLCLRVHSLARLGKSGQHFIIIIIRFYLFLLLICVYVISENKNNNSNKNKIVRKASDNKNFISHYNVNRKEMIFYHISHFVTHLTPMSVKSLYFLFPPQNYFISLLLLWCIFLLGKKRYTPHSQLAFKQGEPLMNL